jgi:hypothetical protein
MGADLASTGGMALAKEAFMLPIEHRRFDDPDETLPYPGATFELLSLAGGPVYRYTFEPGWRYSTDIPPEDRSELCPEPHLLYQVAGRSGPRTCEGEVVEAGPGEVTSLPGDHDAWVIGDERAVVVPATPPSRAATGLARCQAPASR